MSFWGALVWKFRHTNPAQPIITFNWKFALPDGGISSDPEYDLLLESFKTVVWGMLTNDEYGKTLSIGTLPSIGGGVREAFRWFLWKGVTDFGKLTPKLQQQYLAALPQLIVAKHEVYPEFLAEGYSFGYHSPSRRANRAASIVNEQALEDAADDRLPVEDADGQELEYAGEPVLIEDEEDDGVSYSQVANRVSVLYYIYAQRKLLEKNGLPALLHQPFGGKSVGKVSSAVSPHVINRIPALPRAVSEPLLKEVFRWVDAFGLEVASVHQAYQLAKAGGTGALASVFQDLDEAGFSSEDLAPLPWRERVEEGDAKAADHLAYAHHRMRLATLLYRDACVLAVQYMAGLRISEVCSVTVTREKVEGLPSCIYKRVSPDGMMDLYFLKAKLVKGRRKPKDKDWIVGSVPCGSERLPVVVRALNHLHDVMSPFFEGDGEPMPLFFHYSNPWGMPAGRQSVSQASGTDLQRGCRRFVRCFVDLSKLPDHDNFGNSLVSYRQTRGGCIRTHQGRKTFADYCLKTRKSSLSALSYHYGHLSESITYKGYYSPIQRLADEVESMGHSATVDFFVSHGEGMSVFGNMADAVNSFLKDNGLACIEDIRLLREMVTNIVMAHDLRIFFNDFGNCFIAANPLGSRCQQAAGGASWMLRMPNYMTRSISMCIGCDCFCLDESHKPFWEERAQVWSQAAKDPTNRVANSRYKQSIIVLRQFDERGAGVAQ